MTLLALEGFVRLEDGLDLVLVRHGGSVRRRLGQCSRMSPDMAVSRVAHEPRTEGAQEEGDEVRDEGNHQEHSRVVVSRSATKLLRPVVDGDGFADAYESEKNPTPDGRDRERLPAGGRVAR